jgi:O-antigen ligase
VPARAGLLRHPYAVPVVLAIAIFAFACGSSSVAGLENVGRPGRWMLLVALLALVLVSARRQSRPALPSVVLAAGAAFVGIAFVSAVWSVDARLSIERAVTLVVLFATALVLADSSITDPRLARRIYFGIVGGAGLVSVAGLILLAVDHDAAVHLGGHDLPTRYEGIGENPNTVALLLAVCLPLVAWLALDGGSRRTRAIVLALGLLFDGSIIASGSRGSLIAGFSGMLLVVVLAPIGLRAKAVGCAAVAALGAVSMVIALAPKSQGYEQPSTTPAPPPAKAASPPARAPAPSKYVNVEGVDPMAFDIGSQGANKQQPTARPLLGLSGRSQAWSGAITLGDKRPLTGYGFGTEGNVFVDRYALFASGLPENSYIGLYMQLGAVGLISFLALVVALVVPAVRAPSRWRVAAPLGVLLAALLLAAVQSYIYSVGNVATVTVWICAFLAAGTALRAQVRA